MLRTGGFHSKLIFRKSLHRNKLFRQAAVQSLRPCSHFTYLHFLFLHISFLAVHWMCAGTCVRLRAWCACVRACVSAIDSIKKYYDLGFDFSGWLFLILSHTHDKTKNTFFPVPCLIFTILFHFKNFFSSTSMWKADGTKMVDWNFFNRTISPSFS